MLIVRIIGFVVALLFVWVAMGDIGLVLPLTGSFLIVLGTALGGGLMTAGSQAGVALRTLLVSKSESSSLIRTVSRRMRHLA